MRKRTIRRVTQADIAQRLGIHQTTVSAVLRGSESIYVADDTRRRILETAARVGYPLRLTSDVVAGNTLADSNGTVIGILNFSNPVGAGAERLKQAVFAVEAAGYRTLVVDAGWGTDGGKLACDLLLQAGICGVLLCGINDFFDMRLITRFRKNKIPVAAISAVIIPGALTLCSDREQGFAQLVEHLVTGGRKRLWLSTFPLVEGGSIPLHDAQLSVCRGFQQAVEALGIAKDSRIIRSKDRPGAGFSHFEFGYRAMRDLLQRAQSESQPPDAVLCFGDSWAFGAAHACRDAGVRIPVDLALTGYGGEAFTAFMAPPLTTIATPFRKLASVAVEKVIAALQGKTRTLRGLITEKGDLLDRASTEG